jgi:hypothetical protein
VGGFVHAMQNAFPSLSQTVCGDDTRKLNLFDSVAAALDGR